MIISSFWGLVVFGGAMLLLAVLIWAKFNNRVSPEQERRTEQATRDLYKGDPVDHGKR
jgi:hypothetical protein